MYRAPLRELRFVLDELLGTEVLGRLPAFADYTPELAESILGEAGRFAEEILDPLNQSGDREGAHWTPDGVVTAKGFAQAYRQFMADGWPQLCADPKYGGQGAPLVLGTAVRELWGSANLSFKLCPMLTQGAVDVVELLGSPAQQQLFLPKMVSGEWAGTMVLTEPQAGSDLGQIRTRAIPEGDHYRLFGQKIFITWGDHDYTDNIIHMVLARIEGAPQGVRGITLFIVPKRLVKEDGTLGERNDMRCVSIEHKLGIHASPTCVLAYGDKQGAIAYRVGEANRGLEYMFIMMNAARLSVGSEGYALTERAYQRAADWARTRVQGKAQGGGSGEPSTIVHHPDVKRMLLTMKSCTQAMRALSLYAAFVLDLAKHHTDAGERAKAQTRGDLLIPIVKGWSTELGNELTAVGVQIHGGMGFMEETGAAQYVRDVRITTIYEGTTGIQSNDLIGRKLARDQGAAMTALMHEIRTELEGLDSRDAFVKANTKATLEALGWLRDATQSLLQGLAAGPEHALAVSVPYLQLCGFVMGGWLLAKSAAIATRKRGSGEEEFYAAKLASARFYTDQVLPRALAFSRIVQSGAASVIETDVALV